MAEPDTVAEFASSPAAFQRPEGCSTTCVPEEKLPPKPDLEGTLVKLPGDVGYIGSNELHNAKNVGTTRAQYFIVNLGRDDV